MLKVAPYLTKEVLEDYWQATETPVVVNFFYKNLPLTKRAREHFQNLAQKFNHLNITFIDSEIGTEDELDRFIDEYGTMKFPFILIFDYGKELHRFNSWELIQLKLEERVKETYLAGR